jgi:NADPH-dependent curcumin reductase
MQAIWLETSIPTPGPGQVLLGAQYPSLNLYMSGRMDDGESYAPPALLGGGVSGMSSEGGET